MDMDDIRSLYQLLGDETRLRLLRVLDIATLNVTELTSVLDIAQSGVSRHLGLLKDVGLVGEDRNGGFSYYRVSEEARTGRLAAVWGVLQGQFAAAAAEPAIKADVARLQEVLRLRKENFESHGPDERQLVPGRSWAAWARALGHLLPPLKVADLGCGEGYLTLEAARWASSVVAIDRSERVLARARDLARRRRITNVIWKRGELERVPLQTGSVDVALLSQALHHARDPGAALGEAARIVAPGGRVLVLDLRAHEETWVRERLGDRWLGFADDAMNDMLREAGLEDVRIGLGARKTGDPFAVMVASGMKARTKRERK